MLLFLCRVSTLERNRDTTLKLHLLPLLWPGFHRRGFGSKLPSGIGPGKGVGVGAVNYAKDLECKVGA